MDLIQDSFLFIQKNNFFIQSLDSSPRSRYIFASEIFAQSIMNNNKIKFKIGEFSRLNQVTVKTLRHYEEIGLLSPAEIDEWTGYRYYHTEQFQQMNSILYLKRLGFSLEEIHDLFEMGQQYPSLAAIEAKLKQCNEEQKQLEWRQYELNSLAKSLQKSKNMEKVFIKSLPAIIVASHRQILSSYQELFNLCPNIIGPEMHRLGCTCKEPGYCYTIEHSKEYDESRIDLEYCEEVTEKLADSELIQFKEIPAMPTVACMYHRGDYKTFPETFAKLFEYVEQNGYSIAERPRFSYIDGIWNKDSEEDWLTEIQIPVEIN